MPTYDYKFTIENAENVKRVRTMTSIAWKVYKEGWNREEFLKCICGPKTKNFDYIIKESKSEDEAQQLAVMVWKNEVRITVNSFSELISLYESGEDVKYLQTERLNSEDKVVLAPDFFKQAQRRLGDDKILVNTKKGIIEIEVLESMPFILRITPKKVYVSEQLDIVKK